LLSAELVCFSQRSANQHDALPRDLHLPAAASDHIPIGGAHNLTGQHAAVFEQQDAGFTVANLRSGSRRGVIGAHSGTRHRN
jgi:hypothetical protein